ncbi:MAG: NAD(P)H-binding protein [Actinomycetota bacterium]|nr:NAD(P)H-binding protein [Actinomycetota bacterium]
MTLPVTPAQTTLVAGGTGFVGRRLVVALDGAGRSVRVMTRRPDDYEGPGTAVRGDVADPASLEQALVGCTAAYYLVHSLDAADFEARDAEAATAFGSAAAAAGVEQIIYLGGLGDDSDDLSPHLRSRREVESLLGEAGVPVTVLRAGIVIGHGGISWEITRQLVEHLPAMVAPRWVRTRTQPIAVADVVRYLVGVLDHPDAVGRTFEVGGPEVLAYVDMMKRVAAIERRPLPILQVPLLTPALSSRWLSFVTDVDVQAGRNLIDSMVNEVVVRDTSIQQVVPFTPTTYDDAVRAALAERRDRR